MFSDSALKRRTRTTKRKPLLIEREEAYVVRTRANVRRSGGEKKTPRLCGDRRRACGGVRGVGRFDVRYEEVKMLYS